jgi:hypothetical protein
MDFRCSRYRRDEAQEQSNATIDNPHLVPPLGQVIEVDDSREGINNRLTNPAPATHRGHVNARRE